LAIDKPECRLLVTVQKKQTKDKEEWETGRVCFEWGQKEKR